MGCACGLPFDLMEAADGSSNKSRLLVKEPIARKGRNKSRAVLHRDSCYLLWHGAVSPVGGGGDGRLRLQSSSRSAPPSFLLLPVSLPSPSLVSSLLGYTLDRPDGLEGFNKFPWDSVPTKLLPLCCVIRPNSTTSLCLMPTCIMLL